LNFNHLLEIKGQLHDSLLFGATEVLIDNTLIVMIEAHIAQFLFELSILDLIFFLLGFILDHGIFFALCDRGVISS